MRVSSRSGRRAWTIAATSVVVLALVVTDLLLFIHFRDDQDAKTALARRNRTAVNATFKAALASANTKVPQILTYNYLTIDDDITGISADLTGTFKTNYIEVLSQKVKPRAVQLKVVTTSVSRGAAIINATSKTTVSVLVFVNQQTTGTGQSTPQVAGSRVQVTMTKVGAAWLIANLTVV